MSIITFKRTSRQMKAICLFAALTAAALTGMNTTAAQPLPGNDAAVAMIASGDSLCLEMLMRMNRRLNTDSINLIISKIEQWPDKAMSPEYIEYRDSNKPMLLKYADYNKETIDFISYFISTINGAEKRKQSGDRKFKQYLMHVYSTLTETGKFKNTTYAYGPVFHNRNNAPSLPYINKRLKKMDGIIKNYSLDDPSKTVGELRDLREELTPVPSKEEIKRQKLDKKMIDSRGIATRASGIVPSAPNLDSMPDAPEIEIIRSNISKINEILKTLDEWERKGYPSDLIYKLRATTRKELKDAEEKLEEQTKD